MSDPDAGKADPQVPQPVANQPPSKTEVAVVTPQRLEENLAAALRTFFRPDQVGPARGVLREVVRTSTRVFAGPLPAPEVFEGYERVVPGAAERILAMAEKEQGHRHGWEDRHLNWDGWTNIFALTLGWLLSLVLAAGAIYCAFINQTIVATALVGFSAFGAVAQLINGRRMFTKRDHASKPEIPPTKAKPANQKKKR